MRWTRFSVTCFLVIFIGTFELVSSFVPDPQLLIIMRALQIASTGAFTIRYWRAAVIAWKQNFKNEQQVYAFCAVMLSSTLCLNAIWLWLWRSANEPRVMIDSAMINGLLVCLTFIAYTGKIIAPDTGKGRTDKVAYLWVIGVVLVTATLSSVSFLGEPYFIRFGEWLSPFLADSPPVWTSKIKELLS